MLIFKKSVENRKVRTVTFWFSSEFYLETQWKSTETMVFLENHEFPHFLIQSNLFKGLFYGKCEK